MPTYLYSRSDGSTFEVIQKITEVPLSICPETGQAVERVIQGGNFILNGSGWYKDGYSGTSTPKGSKAPSDNSASASPAKESSVGESKACTGTPASCGACGGD